MPPKPTSNPSTRPKSTSSLTSTSTTHNPLPLPHPSISSFNPSRSYYASVGPAGVGKGERLRCWDVNVAGAGGSRVVGEWDLPVVVGEKKGVTSLVWGRIRAGEEDDAEDADGDVDMDAVAKKRRKKKAARQSISSQTPTSAKSTSTAQEIIILAQSTSLLIFSPTNPSHPLTKIPITNSPNSHSQSQAVISQILFLSPQKPSHINEPQNYLLITTSPSSGSGSGSNSASELLLLDLNTRSTLLTHSLPQSQSVSAVSLLKQDAEKMIIALAGTSISLLEIKLPLPTSPSEKTDLTFSAGESISIQPIRSISPLPAGLVQGEGDEAVVFITVEEEARTATIWKNTGLSGLETIGVSSLPSLDPIHSVSSTLSPKTTSSANLEVDIFLTSSTGAISVYTLSPSTFTPSPEADTSSSASNLLKSSSKKSKKKRATAAAQQVVHLEPVGRVVVSSKGAKEEVRFGVVGVEGVEGGGDVEGMEVDELEGTGGTGTGEVVVGWVGSVGRVKWEVVRYRNETSGEVVAEVNVKRNGQELIGLDNGEGSTPLQRSHPTTTTSTQTNPLLATFTEEEAALTSKEMDLPVEGDLADMTLGERLAVLDPEAAGTSAAGGKRAGGRRRAEGAEEDEEEDVDAEVAKGQETLAPQSTQSLTRLLLQALHTSDPALLTLILTSPQNSTPAVVRNTIRKLPASMALPLLKACVERLGKGRGFERRGGGRGGGLTGREGGCVVGWIRGVLVERGSVLMTIPSLPVHLASLSSLLQSRLQLQSPLMSLSGRLDLALAQIELRKTLVPAKPKRQGTIYIEGESESDDEDDMDEDDDLLGDDDDVEIEGDEADIGEIEDVRIESRRETESKSAEGDEEDDELDIPVRQLNGKKRGAKRVVLAPEDDDSDMDVNGELADDDDESEEEDDDDEDDEDDEEFEDDDDDRPSKGNMFVDSEAEEASEDEGSDGEMET